MLINRKILLLVVLIVLNHCAMGQPSIGIPTIRNYTHTDYNAAAEIWDTAQDRNGILYFANDDGLLSFDGSYWKIYQMPNRAAIKSVAIDSTGRIYCGGQDEVGYFFPDHDGILQFHSLKALLPKKAQQFADIWDIVLYKNEVFFRTIECIFELKGGTMKTYDAPGGWRLLTRAGTHLYAVDKDSGLLNFTGHEWVNCCETTNTKALGVTGITSYQKDTLLVATQKNGLYLLAGTSLKKKPTDIDDILFREMITCAQRLPDNHFAIGTMSKGLFIIDQKGKLVEHFSTGEGLQNNNIHSILIDNDENLWLGLENGIDFVNYNTSVMHISPGRENKTKSNSAIVFKNKLFIGTSNGLFSIPVSQGTDISRINGNFSQIENTKGQVWSLQQVGDKLLIGHQDGAMVLNGDRAEAITSGQGAWMFLPMPESPNIIASIYTGLQLLKTSGNNILNEGKIEGIYESLSAIAKDKDNNIVWASHPYRGIYKIVLSPDRKKIVACTQYTDKNGLPSVLNNRVYFLKNNLIAGTEKGVYEYSPKKNRFVKSPFFNKIIGNNAVQYLTDDQYGNIWFISNERTGVIDFSKPRPGKSYSVVYFPELAGPAIKGSAFIYPFDKENIFVASNSGLFHLNYKDYVSKAGQLKVLLTTVKTIAEKDSLIFGGYFMNGQHIAGIQSTKHIPAVTNHWNSFHFEYSSTLFAQKNNEEFSYMLTGFDKGWSKWSAKTEKDYTNLSYGTYTFMVKTRNNLGNASAPVSFTFTVKPGWYQTSWAYFYYALLIIIIIVWAARAQHKKFTMQQKNHRDEQKRLRYLHSLEIDRNEKQIIALKNSNLETELNYKNKELATLTMNLVDRGRLLLNIKDELTTLTKKLNIPDANYHFRSVFKLLNSADKNEDDWNQFSMYFDQVHNNFLSTMKAKFPNLSPTDLKLCAYLRLNLTSKEIAQLLNISLKGVEISRYRVRKKLNLSTDVHLYDFLIEVTN
ncbi:MAG TPA: triple tyrosine motif-containing protein [Mucilaginibacter sp.]|nr:triple tyrosine motif-containing protein [Mucilaginibacter sp.]